MPDKIGHGKTSLGIKLMVRARTTARRSNRPKTADSDLEGAQLQFWSGENMGPFSVSASLLAPHLKSLMQTVVERFLISACLITW